MKEKILEIGTNQIFFLKFVLPFGTSIGSHFADTKIVEILMWAEILI
jgi:hypothetical protein